MYDVNHKVLIGLVLSILNGLTAGILKFTEPGAVKTIIEKCFLLSFALSLSLTDMNTVSGAL